MALPSLAMNCDRGYLSDSDLSSRLSSPASETPSPPPELRPEVAYPSPPRSTESSQSGSPVPDGMDSRNTSDQDGPPPAKRRRISERKPRTTEYLDLRSGHVKPGQESQLDRLLHTIHKRQKIVVVAGAGISVSAGIPDFRSSTGLFTSLRAQHNLKGSGKHLFDASVYKDDSSTHTFHDMVRNMSKLTKSAKPTPFHHMLATLAQDDRLLRLYSQNVDGIDTGLEPLKTVVPLKKDENGKWPRTVQLHGGLDKMVCSKCHDISDFDPDLFDGPTPPICKRCEEVDEIRTSIAGKRSHGIGRLRPRMVLYNEHNPDDEAIGRVTSDDLRKRPDAIIVVGTTLKIPGVRRIVREMCATVRDRRDGMAIWINNDPEPVGKEFEDCWDIVVRGTCDEVARRAALRKWDETVEFEEATEEKVNKAKARRVEVVIPKAAFAERSFKEPPVWATPKHAPPTPAWTPVTSRRSSVAPFEIGDSFTEEEDMAPSTPSKPQKTIAKITKAAPKTKQPSALDALKGGKKTGPTVKTVKKTTTTRKAPAKKTTAGAKAAPKKSLINQAFKQTKSVSVAGKAAKDVKKSPSKPVDIMHPVSPNPRMAVFPNLTTKPDAAVKTENRRLSSEIMKVASIMN